MEVIATEKGYWGGIVREIGDRFVIDDAIMNDKKRRPRWVKAARGTAKVEDDKSNVVSQFSTTDGVVVPEGWERLPAKDKKDLANTINAAIGNPAGKVSNVHEAEEVITAYLGGATKTAPFGDAPAPQTAQGDGVQEALGGTQPTPDWIAPAGETPVEAED